MTIDDYWLAISRRYQIKVRLLAEKHNISTARAFRNIIYKLKDEICHEQNGYFCGYLTGRQIENMIGRYPGNTTYTNILTALLAFFAGGAFCFFTEDNHDKGTKAAICGYR